MIYKQFRLNNQRPKGGSFARRVTFLINCLLLQAINLALDGDSVAFVPAVIFQLIDVVILEYKWVGIVNYFSFVC